MYTKDDGIPTQTKKKTIDIITHCYTDKKIGEKIIDWILFKRLDGTTFWQMQNFEITGKSCDCRICANH